MEQINKKIDFYPPKYHILREHKIQKRNLCSISKAKEIAQQIMQNYDSNKDNKLDLPNGEILQFLRDSYKIFDKIYDPTKPSEIPLQKYFAFMDSDNDGVVGLNDLEKHCLKSLCPVTYLIQEANALIENHFIKLEKELKIQSLKEEKLPALIKSLFKQLQMPSYAPKTSGVNEILMEMKKEIKEERKKIKGEDDKEEFKMNFEQKQVMQIFITLLQKAGFEIA